MGLRDLLNSKTYREMMAYLEAEADIERLEAAHQDAEAKDTRLKDYVELLQGEVQQTRGTPEEASRLRALTSALKGRTRHAHEHAAILKSLLAKKRAITVMLESGVAERAVAFMSRADVRREIGLPPLLS